MFYKSFHVGMEKWYFEERSICIVDRVWDDGMDLKGDFLGKR